MNKKEILMICFIICFIFSLQAVVAADADLNTTDGDSLSVPAVESVETVDVSNDLSSYSLSNDDSIVRGENDGAGSFSELQEKINEDTTGTISLDKNYTFNSSSDSGLTNGIVISKDITIQGNGFTIDALSSARIFNIISGNAVTLVGINFVNGGSASVSNGGSIYSSAQGLTIDNCNFINSQSIVDGGAIYVEGDNCVIANSTFTDNVAGDDGGAINWVGDNGIIYNVNFTNNKGISSGTSHSKGGSISITGSNITVDKSTFTDSSVTYNGGALFITGNDVNITNCDFINCTSDTTVRPSGDDLPYGGAIYIIGNNTFIDVCTFEDCKATNGGVMYIEGDDATINHSTFSTNYANGDGGVIYVAGDNCIIGNSTFNDNVAGDDGGAIYWVGDNGIIYNVNFTSNRGISSGTSHSKGGSISLIGNNITIDKSTFTDSSVTYNGGALFITGDDVNITDCEFINCKSDAAASPSGDDLPYGGAMYIIGDNTRVKGSTIRGSSARAGGAIYIEGVNTVIEDSSFTDNIAKSGTDYDTTNLGGAIYVKGDYTTILGSEFKSSSAYSGGTIYLQGNYCNVTESSVSGGYASNDGGAIYSTGSHSNVIDSNFTDNVAQGDGGAIYWYGGSNSKYNTIIGSSFVDNIAYARTSSNTKGGGAIYWSEGGSHGSIKDSQFINNSVRSNTKADGGAILWDRSNYALIDNCIFDGNYITTTATGDVWVQGGSIYLRADSQFTISNSVFNNSVSDKEAGAIYIQSKTLPAGQSILIVNTTFSNNVAKAIGPNIYGGGAVQIKECNRVYFRNVTFENNTANQGGAVSIYKANDNIQFDDCVFIGNDATNNGGSFWIQSHAYLYNISISNSTAANNGGGIYAEGELTNNNLTFINNTALNGGGLYMNRNAANNLQTMTFTNNTATQYGGGVYLSRGTNTLTNVNMTGNKAFSGSAIYSAVAFKLINAYLIKNQANSSSLTFATYSEDTGEVVLLFKGKDKYLNAIYVTGSNRPTCTNVTYWNENGIANTGSSATTLPNTQDPTPEAGQNITVGIYDDTGRLLNPDNQYFITDANGKVYLNFHEIIPDVPASKYGEIYVEAILTNDDYYTIIKLTSRAPSSINASATPTTYHSNSTISVNVTQGATGNVSVYLNDTFLGNITLENSKGSMELSTLIEGKYLPAGNHTLSFVYGGNAKYDVSNTTAILEINKITPVILLNVTGLGYNLIVNVTVMDGEYGIADATGNVTIQVAGRTATIYLGNSQGMTIIYGVPIGNYTVNATYNGDNNYYPVTNSTDANVTEKTQTVLIIDLDNEKTYFINETVPIKVTILPNAEGNITLYINGVPHVLPLEHEGNSTFVNFNATELIDGVNYVFATYDGTELYAPSWAQDSFNVTKYNATIGIDAADITYGDTEVINITLPEDATGILNVTVNGTSYYVEIINGTASLPVSNLGVGEYNVTVRFNEDKKYYNATNSRLFKVNKATPSLHITVENITYGENATVVVTLPDGVSGNVTIKLGEDIVFTEAPIDGQATFTLKDLPASNYTIEATFNGNENYTVVSNSTNFTVFKATPIVNVTVEDIYYGDAEHIIIKVNAEGNVTVKVNGAETVLNVTSQGNETYVYDLAVGSYPVEVTFNGNENYTSLTVTKEFNVYPVNTTLDVQVHDILVWDKESINVTLADNATGNVIININGENHTVPIVNGTAQLNLTDLSVGHKVVWVFYDGDKNYTANRTMAEFDVGQRTPEVNVTALNVTVDQDGLITINIPENATGFVILSGNFTKHPIYVDEFTNGKAEIAIGGLAVGTYSVHIKYYGDALDNYTVAENDTTFNIGRTNTTITIAVESIDYGQKANITVTVNDDATGYITIRINETQSITLPVVNGKANWIVDGLAADNYTVYANYSGDAKYNVNETSKAFEVRKIAPEITIEPVEVDGATNATVIVHITPGTTGDISITVNNKNYTGAIDENGVARIIVDVLPVGEYDITANYTGDKNYTNASAKLAKGLNVTKVDDYAMNVTAVDVKVGENTTITVNVPKDATGNVTIWVNGTTAINTTIVNGVATFNITKDIEGKYTVNATLSDPKYANKTVETVYYVSRNDTPMNITVLNDTLIYVGDVVKVVVSVPSDATGNVTIEIDGKTYTNETINGNATFYITDLIHGDKSVYATYEGNNKYVSNSTTAKFTVYKRDSFVKVNVTNSTVGSGAVINVTVPKNATGQVIVSINGTDYSINVTNGTGSITVYNLGNGTYDVNVTYTGDEQYLASNNSTKLGIEKIQPTISVNGTNITAGEGEFITIETPDNITSIVKVEIDGKNYTAFISEGKGNLTVYGLAAGKYNVTVYFEGNDKYLNASAKNSFIVSQNSTSIDVSVMNITYTENETVIVYVDATGNVTLTIDSIGYANTTDIVDGKAIFVIKDLAAGNYTVNATFNGNVNMTMSSKEANFTVFKATPEVNVTVTNITYYDIENIVVAVNTGGNVTVKVNGTIVAENVALNSDNSITIPVKDLKAGTYPVEVTFNGNANYTDGTVSTFFVVNKAATTLDVQVADIAVDGKEVINVTISNVNATGNVIINVDGVNYTRPIANGQANLTLDKLANGTHSVVVIYEGDANLTGSWISKTFNVSKLSSQLTINVTNTTTDGVETIKVNVTAGATGTVVITVDGINHHVEIEDGFATLVLSNLTAGIHDVHAEYLGDANYTGCEGDASFNVEKINSTVSVNVDNITVGDVAVINITVTPNATGNVTIKIGDEFTQTVGIVDGVITVNVPDLTVGDKTVEVTYNGDGKYLPSNATAKFTVGKTAAEIQLLVENVTYGEVETITILVNATGNVTIEIDGMEPVVRDIVDGKVIYPVSELNAGNYTVKVTYNGNGDVNSTSAEANFTIFKADPIITVDVEDIIYGNVEHIIVHSNAEGNVTIKVNGQEVTIVLSEGEGGHAVLRAARWDVPEYDGKATLDVYGLPVGNYPVEVTFNGNENYNELTVNTDFDVIKDKTEVSVQVESPINVGESQVINIAVNNTNVTGNVTINIDGQNYTAELTNGTANFTVPPLASGNHTVVVVYEGDNNFTGNWTSANIVVNKLESTVNITVSNGTVGSKQTITVEVPQNATGQVLIDINDQHYYANITDGKAILELDTLPEGEYSVNATYLGDENYTSSHNSDKFIVTKNKSTVNITPQNITFGENEVITFTVPEDATGNITVVVNNKTYIVPVSGGQGNLTVPDLHAGEYTINATYNGDDKYLPSQNNATFKVDKKDVELDVIDQGNRTVVVTVSDNATGTIEIKIDGETYNATIENGKAVITLTNATPGEHEIEVTYSGDADHNNKTTNAAINAPKYDAPISAEVDSIYVGDKALINVTLPEDATGNVTVEINGKVYEPVSFENGVAKFEIEDLAFGDKTVAVKYSGDSNYLANSTTTNFTVSKRNSTVNVSDISIDVGEDAVINVTVPENATGWVHVTIGNNTYAIKVEDGKGSTTISGLSSGTYDVEAVYLGDDQYLPSNNTFTIKVSKVPSSVNISVENITVGDKAVIDITVPEDVCGNVTVTVNGKNHTVFVSGGHGTLVIPDLPVGNYTVEAIFDGCKKYEPSNNTAQFTVSKIKSVIRPIDLGNNTVIVVVPENATGNVTIKVGNNTYVANVTNGTATITLDNETPGTHDITVIYSGDDNHTSTSVDSTVNIIKLDTPIKVSVKDIKVGDDEVVTVTLPKDATGKVTFEIDGRKYTVDVKDGKATVNIPNLAAGSKTIAVSYSGDAKYLPNTSTAKFKVSKRESTISAKSKNINVGTDEVIIVNVPKDATGRVLVNINGVGYYANVINGVAKVIIPELPSGKYTAKVTYEGNAKYLQSKTITTTFTVTKVKTPISADGDDIEQGQEATVVVKVPNDATGTVTIGVNGKKYTNYVEDGKAVFEISGLKKGDYNVEASYSGDKKYEANNTITDIIVTFHDDDNGNHAGNGGSQDSANDINLADHPTGNPIFALLLILVVLASTQIRRFKK